MGETPMPRFSTGRHEVCDRVATLTNRGRIVTLREEADRVSEVGGHGWPQVAGLSEFGDFVGFSAECQN